MTAPADVVVENFVLCDWAAWDQEQRPTIHGLVSRIEVPSLPQVRDVLSAVFEVWGPPRAEVALRVRIEGPAGSPPFPEAREFRLPLDEHGMRGVGANLEQVVFAAEGDYAVVVTRGEQVVGRRRFRVTLPRGPSIGVTTTASLGPDAS